MQSFAVRATLLLGVLAAVFVGCQVPDDGDEALDEELGGEEDIQTTEQAITAVPLCGDIVLHEVKQKFCDWQDGALDDSPIFVQCTRTCVTDRYIIITPFTPGQPGNGVTCGVVDTECTAWDCPSCL